MVSILYYGIGSCVFFLFLTFHQVQLQQTFIRNCNDPYVIGHTANFSHSYCHHSCGFPTFGMSECTAAGYCICPCDPNQPAAAFGADLCPQAGDIADTDANAIPNCQATCAGVCPGGQGAICGDIGITNGKICTCICPPSSCPGATTPSPSSTQIIFIPLPLILKKIKYILKVYAIKLYIYGLLVLSLILKFVFLKFSIWLIYESILYLLSRLIRRFTRIVMPIAHDILLLALRYVANYIRNTEHHYLYHVHQQ